MPVPPEPLSHPASADHAGVQAAVYPLYCAAAAAMPGDAEAGLGGKLLFAGELGAARELLYAANIAGAASLAASADVSVQRQAMRDGVVDFLVTSLDEALRILKNEIRKRQTVSVSVGLTPQEIVLQMLERGVLPDLLPPKAHAQTATGLDESSARRLIGQGALHIGEANTHSGYVTWAVDRDAPRWLPRLDALVMDAVPEKDGWRRRWLRLAPRYLGRTARQEHGVALSAEETAKVRDAMRRLLAGDAGAPQVILAGEVIP